MPCRAISGLTAQIVSGIGFLGAGVIIRVGLSVRGLNTAATLWCSTSVATQGVVETAALRAGQRSRAGLSRSTPRG
ncbi:MgtC/SapB family protein [Streptomyces noursei]|uniref:MgtC/SapB family protein n=1 Tax=Streptomyces noursei TaxID=1971 RepID=UPI003F54017B